MKHVLLTHWLTPTVSLLLVISGLTLIGAAQPVSSAMVYQDTWWSSGEVWRPVTAWMAQLNVNHWLVNQWGLVLMAVVLPPRLNRSDLLALAWVWLACSLALATSRYTDYAGLSGVLYGWLLWSVLRSPFYAIWIRWGVAGVITVKVIWENLPGQLVGEASAVSGFIGADIAVQSHAWGLAAGWLAVLASQAWTRWSPAQRG